MTIHSGIHVVIERRASRPPAVSSAGPDIDHSLGFERAIAYVALISIPPALGNGIVLHGGRSWGATVAMLLLLLAGGSAGVALGRTRPHLLGGNRYRIATWLTYDVVLLIVMWNFVDPRVPAWIGFMFQIIVSANRWQVKGSIVSLAMFILLRSPMFFLFANNPAIHHNFQELGFEVSIACVTAGYFGFNQRVMERNRMALNGANQELTAIAARLAAVLENIADAVLTVDEAGCVETSNQAAGRLFRSSALVGRPLGALLRGPDATAASDPGRPGGGRAGDSVGIRVDGSEFVVEVRASVIPSPQHPIRIVLIRDVTQQRAHTAELAHLANHDTLTALPNRHQFSGRLEARIAAASASGEPVSILMMDMDGFKQVNDTLGHPSGDRLLQQVAGRLRAVVRESDLVARLGGDEFAILPGGRITPEAAQALAGKVVEAMKRPFTIDGETIAAGISIGVASFPVHGVDAATLVRHADVAMYSAKRARRGYTVYTPAARDDDRELFRRASDLRRAVENDEFIVHFQPIVRAQDGVVTALEALVRWQLPDGTILQPGDFIPTAEQSEVIRPLTRLVLGKALQQLKIWRDDDFDVTVSVNIAGRNINDVTLPGTVETLLRRWGVPASRLTLEISENAMLSGVEVDVLNRLAGMGVRISIDDYGTGSTSLIHLRRAAITELKIDRSLVGGMTGSPEDALIIGSTIELAHHLGIIVVAEGVEDVTTLNALREMDCDLIQGWVYGPARAVGEIDLAAAQVPRDARAGRAGGAAPNRVPDRRS